MDLVVGESLMGVAETEANNSIPWYRRLWVLSVGVLSIACLVTTLMVNVGQIRRHGVMSEPPAHLMGWDEAGSQSDAAKAIKATLPKFKISGAAKDSAGAKVFLWHAAKQVLGREFETNRQEIGDCVSFGSKHAAEFLQFVAIASGEAVEFKPIFSPYHYATGRVLVGRNQIRGPDGSVGAWQQEAVTKYGVIPADTDGLPAYSAAVARAWATRKPDQKYIDAGRLHLVQTTAQINSYEEARDALANSYPVVVCSNRGFEMQPRVHEGKHWGVPAGQWAHCMVFIGVDDTVMAPRFAGGGKGGLYCLNSWGPDAHGSPAGDEPAGGFWVSSTVATSMLRQDDSYAYSNLQGFPARAPDWDFQFGLKRKKAAAVVRAVAFAALAL